MIRTLRRLPGRSILLFTIFLLLASPAAKAHANPPPPSTPPAPAVPSWETSPVDPGSAVTAGPLALSPLKAVLIVGPIDGDNGSATTTEKKNMELAAAELEAKGVKE